MPTDQKGYRVYLPPDLASSLEEIARVEDRPITRLLREAVRMLVQARIAEKAEQK